MGLAEDTVRRILEQRVAPLIRADGGEIELVGVTEDGIVRIRLGLACSGCPGAQYTTGSLVTRELEEGLEGFRGLEILPGVGEGTRDELVEREATGERRPAEGDGADVRETSEEAEGADGAEGAEGAEEAEGVEEAEEAKGVKGTDG